MVLEFSMCPKVLYMIRLNWNVLSETVLSLGLMGERTMSLWFIVSLLCLGRTWAFGRSADLFWKIGLGMLIGKLSKCILWSHENLPGLLYQITMKCDNISNASITAHNFSIGNNLSGDSVNLSGFPGQGTLRIII